MVINIQNSEGYKTQYLINDYEDFDKLIQEFPSVHSIIKEANSLTEACHHVAQYIGSHNLDAWVEEKTDLAKNIRTKAVALGILASSFLSPKVGGHALNGNPIKELSSRSASKINMPAFGKNPEDKFLWATMHVETSGGTNLAHKEIKHGKYKGERAIGRWGLLKPTVDEILNRKRLSGKLTPEFSQLETMDRNQIAEHFEKNPHIELDLARDLAKHVIGRQNGDLKRASYSWLYGHNLYPDHITDNHITSEPYVKKFASAYKKAPFKDHNVIKKSALKTEAPEAFRQRIGDWIKHREDLKRTPQPRQSNDGIDPGRIRDTELDRKPADKTDQLESLKEKIEAAKKGNKK